MLSILIFLIEIQVFQVFQKEFQRRNETDSFHMMSKFNKIQNRQPYHVKLREVGQQLLSVALTIASI